MHRALLAAATFAGVALAGGCYNPSFDNPTCPTGECPSGFTCVQGQCVSGNSDIDAPNADGTDRDATITDGTPAVDAPVDANPCTGVSATWTRLTPTTSPPARYGHSMAYDPTRQRVVLFGGRTGPTNADLLGDTWEFDGTTWTQRTVVTPPTPRSDAAMVYDEAAGRVMMYGGYTSGGGTQSTYLWDGAAWSSRSTTGSPSFRHDHGLAYDTVNDRAVLFGGFLGGVGVDGHTWEWNTANSTWTDRTPATSPSPRLDHAMAFDVTRGLTVLFGGPDNQTWTWDQTTLTWTPRTTAPCTPPGSEPTLVHDPSRSTVVLLTGTDVWEWNGTGWTKTVTNAGPASLDESAAAYSTASSGIVVFGGLAGTPLGDTWILDVQ
ncbi:MAG TPA: kelch repeat-containing protein [Kofleriaceae bacterium]|nr:kelch repeat-containing protein [Kofleriaceae bacterium]